MSTNKKTLKHTKTSSKLVFFTILFSSLLTLVITLLQLYFEYHSNVNTLNKNISNIKTGYHQGISNAVWLDDKIQLNAILEGIYALPDIIYIEVKVGAKSYSLEGKRSLKNAVRSSFELNYTYNNKNLVIGETFIEASLNNIHDKLINRAWTLFLSNLIKTTLVVLFMYYLFERLVFRKLKIIFEFVHHHDIHRLEKRIDFPSLDSETNSDEFTEIANSLNNMQIQLSNSISDLLHFQTTLDLLQDGVFMFYPDTYHFFYANNGALKLLGYSLHELSEMTPIDISHDFDKLRFNRLIHQIVEDKQSAMRFEVNLKNRNGLLIPVRLTLQYIAPENEKPRFVFIARDITQRKNDEKLLLSSIEEANTANAAKSKFLMSMSHELRTPLNAILGFAQILELDSDTMTDNQNDTVRDIILGGELLFKLIEDILDLTKIESNNISLHHEMSDPVELINQSHKIVYPMAVMKKITIENKISDSSLPKINIDPTRFKQIIINLLTNAIKYNNKNGIVIIDYELRKNNIIRFKISDTGFGIAKTEHKHVFSSFNRLGYEGGEIEGTGIGLNITKKLVELMNGKIDFDSTPGNGSSFWIDFPYNESS